MRMKLYDAIKTTLDKRKAAFIRLYRSNDWEHIVYDANIDTNRLSWKELNLKDDRLKWLKGDHVLLPKDNEFGNNWEVEVVDINDIRILKYFVTEL